MWTLTRCAQLVCDPLDSLRMKSSTKTTFSTRKIIARTLLDNAYRNSERNATNTNSTPVSLLQPYLTSKGLLKLSHGSYDPTTSAMLTNLSLLCDNYWQTSRTKTNQRTVREQFTRSNAVTARLLILVRPAEIWTSDCLNTSKQLEMVISTITLHHLTKQTTELTRTLLNALPMVQTTFNESHTGKLVY